MLIDENIVFYLESMVLNTTKPCRLTLQLHDKGMSGKNHNVNVMVDHDPDNFTDDQFMTPVATALPENMYQSRSQRQYSNW